MTWYNKKDEQQLFADVAARAKNSNQKNKNDEIVAQRIAAIYSKYPYMATGVVLSLAEAGADEATIKAAADRSAYNAYLKAANNPPPPSLTPEQQAQLDAVRGPSTFSWSNVMSKIATPVKWAWEQTGGRSDELKAGVRVVTATAETAKQVWDNYASRITDPNRSTNDIENFWASTSLGALSQNWDKAGEGFFVGGEAEKIRVEKVKKYRWQMNGQSYTIGRGAANMVFTPGSRPFSFLSGLIDAGIAWKGDPTNAPIDEISKTIQARKLLQPLQTAEEISAARKLAAGGAGLLSTAEQHAIDNSRFFNWLDNSITGRRVVQRTAAENDPLEILKAYNGKISAEEALRLSRTSDVNEIRGIIAEQAIRLSDETTQGFVPFADRAADISYSKLIPAYKLRQSSRWLAKVPKNQMIVHGTEQEKVQAIFNIDNWLKLLKVDSKTGEGKALVDKAFEWASSTGTRVDADQMFRMFMGDVPRKQKGIMWLALEKANVKPETIETIIEEFRSGVDTLRKNAIDEHGMTDDAGFIKHMTQFMTDDELEKILKEIHPDKVTTGMTRTQLDDVVYNLNRGELTLFGPLSMADMLNHVQVLPDPRQIRRLVNDEMFRLSKKGEQLKASSIAEWVQNEIWRPYALMSLGYIMRNTMDAQLRLGLHGFFSDPIQYMLIAMRKRGLGTIKGSLWTEVGEDIPFGLDDLDEYRDFTQAKSKYLVEDPSEQLLRMVKNGEATVVNTSDPAYITGLVDSARMNYADPFMRLAAQISHLPDDRQVQIVAKWLGSGSEDAVKARNTIVKYLQDGPLTGSTRNGINRISAPISNAGSMSDDELVKAWFEIAGRPQVDNLTLNRDELRVIAGYNSVPAGASEIWDEAQVMRFSVTGKAPKPGEILVEPVTTMSGKTFYRNYLVMEINGGVSSGATPGISGGGTWRSKLAVWGPETRIDLQDGFTTADEIASFSESEKALSKAFIESIDDTEFVYHATPTINVDSIANKGLTPQSTIDEFGNVQDPATYVSDNLPNMYQNAPSPASQAERLGSGELAVLRFKLPENSSIDYGTRIGEGVLTDVIDPRNIEVLTSDGTWVSLTKLVSSTGISSAAGSGPKSFKVIPVEDVGRALNGDTGSDKLRKFMKQQLEDNNKLTPADAPILPTWVRNMIRTKPVALGDITETTNRALKAFQALPKWFFDVPVQKWTELAERSPAFRFAYFENVADSARLLSPAEATKLMDELDSHAARVLPTLHASDPAKAVEKYVGGRKFYDQLKKSIADAQAGSGQGTVEQLHVYSATKTKSDLQELFFNNVERSNLTDSFRILAPFGAAWAEVAGRYSRELIQNPSRIRKTQLVYRGAEGFDPDQDGRGMIYRDPQSGDMMFTFPLSGQIIKAVTGQEGINLSAPVKRLSAGLAIIPSVGPVFQIAATQVFNVANIPTTDDFRKIILPYGDSKFANLVPGTWQKLYSAVTSRPDELSTIYGNTYADLFAYMSTTGEYDLNDSEDVLRLHEDAKIKARGLTVIRAISQFVGPTAARPEYRYEKESGEFFWVNEMVKQYDEWKKEDYDTAVGKFLDVFGDDALIYLGAKSNLDPRYKGVEASEAYGEWEAKNKDLISQFKSTAPYLAPMGDRGLAMEVWSRQIGTGIRRRNEPIDRLEQAQLRLGSYLFADFRRKNPDATAAEKRAERARIHKKYKGFPLKANFNTGDFENFITKMTDLMQDSRTQNNPVADTIREYLTNRQETLNRLYEEAGVGFGSTKAIATGYKNALFKRGEELATLNPDFRRVWEQEFSAELE